MIASRRNQGDYQTSIGNGRGKRLTDEIRKEFDDFIVTEQQLRMARNEKVNSVTVWAITAFVLFIVTLSALLAYLGRRDLLLLSNSYVDNLQAQRRATERLEHQAWLRSGQTQLAEQVLGQLTLAMLGDNILRFSPVTWAAWWGPSMYAMNKGNWCVWPATAWTPNRPKGH